MQAEVNAFERKLEAVERNKLMSKEGRMLLSLIRSLFTLLARHHGWR